MWVETTRIFFLAGQRVTGVAVINHGLLAISVEGIVVNNSILSTIVVTVVFVLNEFVSTDDRHVNTTRSLAASFFVGIVVPVL